MVTGIETAGLVLAAFPVVLEGLKYYIDCTKQVKDIRRHRVVLNRFMRDIKTEMTIFEDTWNRFTGYKLPDGGVPKLPTHLHTNLIDSIENVCQGMKDVLEILQQKLQKYEQTEVCAQADCGDWRNRY